MRCILTLNSDAPACCKSTFISQRGRAFVMHCSWRVFCDTQMIEHLNPGFWRSCCDWLVRVLAWNKQSANKKAPPLGRCGAERCGRLLAFGSSGFPSSNGQDQPKGRHSATHLSYLPCVSTSNIGMQGRVSLANVMITTVQFHTSYLVPWHVPPPSSCNNQ